MAHTNSMLEDASNFAELPEGCGHLIDTSGPPGLLKRFVALAAFAVMLAGFALAVWKRPLLAGCALAVVLAVVLVVDFAVLVRFRRHNPRGPRDQQRMLCSWTQHAATLLHLRDPAARERVLAAASRAADGGHTRLVFAGRPQLNSSRSPKLTGDLAKDEPTPWHLFLITEHRTGADYESFSRAAGLVPGGEEALVKNRFVAGFRPPSRLVYPMLPLVFDMLGVMVRFVDLLCGHAPRAAFKRGNPSHPPQLQPLLRFLEGCQTDPAWAAQPFIMFNIMKAAEEKADQSKDKWYMFQQVLAFASALRIRPFMVHMGGINPLTDENEQPWFEQCVCMFHPSAVWMYRMLNSTYWERVGASKVLGDMETILIVPLSITS